MNTQITVKETFDNLDSAIEAAKQAGNDIFAGYTNCIAQHRNSDKRCGVTEYHLTENNEILYVASIGKRKCLNKVQLHCSLDNAPLRLAKRNEDGFFIAEGITIAKSSKDTISEALGLGWILMNSYLASQFDNV